MLGVVTTQYAIKIPKMLRKNPSTKPISNSTFKTYIIM